MTEDEIIVMARQVGFTSIDKKSQYLRDCLERFADLVASAEREAWADIADKLPRTYRETKEAHERATLEPFHPLRFGFDFAEMQQAEVITHTIRARGQA